jgi:predicted ABC-type transport system involved in lysophospholipase L1 biosynthesis ATPase subunit
LAWAAGSAGNAPRRCWRRWTWAIASTTARESRAVANEPRVILADEPTGDLDREAGLRIMELLAELRREHGLTVVLVTHNPDLAATAPRTVRVLDGRVVANGQPTG